MCQLLPRRIENAGHSLAEEQPDETLRQRLAFFSGA
jgi:pimeloyl-ACP methyl ester carboxylesterase